jgi:hypothetical protein
MQKKIYVFVNPQPKQYHKHFIKSIHPILLDKLNSFRALKLLREEFS